MHVCLCAQMCAFCTYRPWCRPRFEPWTAMLWLLAHSDQLSHILFIFDMPRGSGVMLKKKNDPCLWRKSGQPNGSFEDFSLEKLLWDCSLRANHATPYEVIIGRIQFGFRINHCSGASKKVTVAGCQTFSCSLPVKKLKHLKSGRWLGAASECWRHLMANSASFQQEETPLWADSTSLSLNREFALFRSLWRSVISCTSCTFPVKWATLF